MSERPTDPGRGRGGPWEPLARGDLARLAYRLGRAAATGVLAIRAPRGRPEVLILRRGHLITAEHDALGRAAALRLARLAALDGAAWSFDGGTAAYPPGAARQLDLAAWARGHLEAQVDAGLAERLVAELAGVRLAVRADRAPAPADDTDRRLLAAMAQPRRLDEIASCARAPRFRLLAFVHVLRTVGALTVVGVGAGRAPGAAPRAAPPAPVDPRAAAHRLLGVDGDAPREVVKRAYRRLARALHPDLHPGLPDARRRDLEAKLAAVTAAYEQLV